jgi:hypothetical protein
MSEGQDNGRRDSRGSPLPTPDPTKVTTENIEKSITALRELLEARVDGLVHLQDEKINQIKAELDGLDRLYQEYLAGVERRFVMVEEQRREHKQDDKDSLGAALAAAKELSLEDRKASDKAIDKSDAATARAIEALKTTFDTTDANRLRDIGELKDRVGKIENLKNGVVDARERSGAIVGYIGVAIGIIVGIAGVVVAVVAAGAR